MKKVLGILIVAVVMAVVLIALPQLGYSVIALGVNSLVWYALVLVVCLIVIVSLIKGIRWMRDRRANDKGYMPAVLFATGSLLWFIGGIYYQRTKMTMDIQLHDTYYVISYSIVMYGMAVFLGLSAGIYYIFSGSFSRRPLSMVGYVHFWVSFVGCCLLLWPRKTTGLAGMPIKYVDYGWRVYEMSMYVEGIELLAVVVMQVVFVGMIVYLLSKRFFTR
jgi:cytochrome c oxidase subunit 1